ncbi:IS110 family transposase [Ensifer sp. SL37]|uniref:IS110 family transposase n=1 Tax=Ensifer sp. SL37 TaxID=2995137 RepID=UPI0022738DD8|nr:transposase [Ensifer sp. SL37]MCY1740824.1 Tn3 family transposase [Ensifer sp. SL37]
MGETSIIGINLAKGIFHLHGICADGSVAFRRRLSCCHVLPYLAGYPACLVAMEACASAHYWAREISKLGHDVRLIAPQYVKPFVNRRRNDAADAEAIAEAASRPTMRFVALKDAEQESYAMVLKTRELLLGQRAQVIDALHRQIVEHGLIALKEREGFDSLEKGGENGELDFANVVRDLSRTLLVGVLSGRISVLDEQMRKIAKEEEVSCPNLGTAIADKATPALPFPRVPEPAAWLGLTLKRNSTYWSRVGETSQMWQKKLRRVVRLAAAAVLQMTARYGAAVPSRFDSQPSISKGEATNRLNSAACFNGRGELRDRSIEGQTFRVSGLNLVVSVSPYGVRKGDPESVS